VNAPAGAGLASELAANLEALTVLVRGLAPAELGRPQPEGWTAREVLAHLADFELMAAVRVRTVLTLDRPALAAYGQEEFTARFAALETAEEALERLTVTRRATARVVAELTDADLARPGVHPERGEEPLRRTLEMLVRHDRAHLDQLRTAARG
jgi:hypothetical protein